MSELRIDLSSLDRAIDALTAETKKFDPDQPRAANGEWGSGGGSGRWVDEETNLGPTRRWVPDDDGSHDDDPGPGTGYDDADQERHDRATETLTAHVASLHLALDRASTTLHDSAATADQIAQAAQAVAKHYDAAGAALDAVNSVRDLYGDEHHEVPVLGDHIDLRDSVDSFASALDTLRSETRDRARIVAQMQAQEAALLDPAERLRRDLEEAIRGAGKARPDLSVLARTVDALAAAVRA